MWAVVAGAVGHNHYLEIDGVVVDRCGIAVGVVDTEIGNAAVPEIVGGAGGIGQIAGVDHARAGQAETVARNAAIAFPDQRAQSSGKLALGRRQNAVDGNGFGICALNIPAIPVKQHHAPEGFAVIPVDNNNGPAAVVAQAAGLGASGQAGAAHRVGAVQGVFDNIGDIGVGHIGTPIVGITGMQVEMAIASGVGPNLLIRAPGSAQINGSGGAHVVLICRRLPAPVQLGNLDVVGADAGRQDQIGR